MYWHQRVQKGDWSQSIVKHILKEFLLIVDTKASSRWKAPSHTTKILFVYLCNRCPLWPPGPEGSGNLWRGCHEIDDNANGACNRSGVGWCIRWPEVHPTSWLTRIKGWAFCSPDIKKEEPVRTSVTAIQILHLLCFISKSKLAPWWLLSPLILWSNK